MIDKTIRFHLHLHSLYADKFFLPFPLLSTLYETDLKVSESNLTELLSGLRVDFDENLVRQPQAFTGTLNADFNVLFISLPSLECSLLILTVAKSLHTGCECGYECLCEKTEDIGAWSLKAQIWGWEEVQEGCCDSAVKLIQQRVLQCKLETLTEAYKNCLTNSQPSLITPSSDVLEWMHQYRNDDKNEDSKVKLDAICSLDVFFSFFFQSLTQLGFVPIRQETDGNLPDIFPVRNMKCIHCTRCDGRFDVKPLRIGNGFEFLILNDSSSLLSFLRIGLVHEIDTKRETITSILSHQAPFDSRPITAESLLAHIPTSLKGSMAAESPFSKLWLKVAVWSAPIRSEHTTDMSLLKETNLKLKYEVIALAKQARMEYVILSG